MNPERPSSTQHTYAAQYKQEGGRPEQQHKMRQLQNHYNQVQMQNQRDDVVNSERITRIVGEAMKYEQQRISSVMAVIEALRRVGLTASAEAVVSELKGMVPAAVASEADGRESDYPGSLMQWMTKQVPNNPDSNPWSYMNVASEDVHQVDVMRESLIRFMNFITSATNSMRLELNEVAYCCLVDIWVRTHMKNPSTAMVILEEFMDYHPIHSEELKWFHTLSKLNRKATDEPIVRSLLLGRQFVVSLSIASVHLLNYFVLNNHMFLLWEIIQRRCKVEQVASPHIWAYDRSCIPCVLLSSDPDKHALVCKEANATFPPFYDAEFVHSTDEPIQWGLPPETITETDAKTAGYDVDEIFNRIPEFMKAQADRYPLRIDCEITDPDAAPPNPPLPIPETWSIHNFITRKLLLRNISRRHFVNHESWPSTLCATVKHPYADISAVAYERLSNASSVVAVALTDGNIHIWDTVRAEAERALNALHRRIKLQDYRALQHEQAVSRVSVDNNGAYLVDNTINDDPDFSISEMISTLVDLSRLDEDEALSESNIRHAVSDFVCSSALSCGYSTMTSGVDILSHPYEEMPYSIVEEYMSLDVPRATIEMTQHQRQASGVVANVCLKGGEYPTTAMTWLGADFDCDRLTGQVLLVADCTGIIKCWSVGNSNPGSNRIRSHFEESFTDDIRYDFNTCQSAEICHYTAHTSPVWDLAALEPWGGYFVSTSSDGTCRLWAIDRHLPLRTFVVPSDVLKCDIHPNRTYVGCVASDKIGRIFDIRSANNVTALLLGCNRTPTAFKFSPNGKMAACASSEGQVLLWDLRMPKKPMDILEYDSECTSISWSYGSAVLGAGYRDGRVAMYDTSCASLNMQSSECRIIHQEEAFLKNRSVAAVDFDGRNVLRALAIHTK